MSEMVAYKTRVVEGRDSCGHCAEPCFKCESCAKLFVLFDKIVCEEETDSMFPRKHYHLGCFEYSEVLK